jgi:hypothetical protein
VSGQALVGTRRVRELRHAIGDARIWPFETGARLPAREDARVLFAEIYPSLFHVRDRTSEHVHDKLQVEAAARSHVSGEERRAVWRSAPGARSAARLAHWQGRMRRIFTFVALLPGAA